METSEENPLDLDNRRYLDGPGFAKWLRTIVPDSEELNLILGESSTRRLYDWEHGAPAYYITADKALVKLGMVLDQDVPEELWIPGSLRPGGRPKIPLETRLEAEHLIVQGVPPKDIAQKVGVSTKTVHRWRKALAGNE